MKTPQIKPHFRLEIIEPEQVNLLAENRIHALSGEMYCQIVPLLDGNHTIDQILRTLEGQVLLEHINYEMKSLEDKDYLSETVPELTSEASGFWSLMNVQPQDEDLQPELSKINQIALKANQGSGNSAPDTPEKPNPPRKG
ncbi:MAG: hypothetical protein QNJ70_06155 [Xenococcaceae cyanobacterium MO_207.B15]|nr:hypothetical protein [Xenococcaceae cyanobacterium MO_207.B15]